MGRPRAELGALPTNEHEQAIAIMRLVVQAQTGPNQKAIYRAFQTVSATGFQPAPLLPFLNFICSAFTAAPQPAEDLSFGSRLPLRASQRRTSTSSPPSSR